MKGLHRIIIGSIAAITVLLLPVQVRAAVNLNNAGDILETVSDPDRTGLSQDDISTGSGKLIQRALTAVGMIFLVLMIYAGILWMTARGNEEQIGRARDTIIAAIIGIVVVVGAYAVTSFVLQRLAQGADGSAGGNGGGGGAPGCCMDKVNAGWACRVTSLQDCQTRGLTCEAGDDFCTASDYRFNEDIDDVQTCVQQCENL